MNMTAVVFINTTREGMLSGFSARDQHPFSGILVQWFVPPYSIIFQMFCTSLIYFPPAFLVCRWYPERSFISIWDVLLHLWSYGMQLICFFENHPDLADLSIFFTSRNHAVDLFWTNHFFTNPYGDFPVLSDIMRVNIPSMIFISWKNINHDTCIVNPAPSRTICNDLMILDTNFIELRLVR